jgi:hypothetical protein
VGPLLAPAFLRFSGKDARSFLHRLSTQDLAGLAPGASAYAAFLTAKGHLVGEGHVLARVDDLLLALDQAAAQAGTSPTLLVQVDLAGEATKHGAAPESVRRLFDIGARCTAARVAGLMLLPPYADDPERVRPYFRRLRALRDSLAADGVDPGMLGELSMGMSHDFEAAVEEGATIVRVGTAIFGPRG